MKTAHIFVDNSNVIGGAIGLAEEKEPRVPWVCIRVDLDNLFALIEGSYLPSTRFFSGSLPPNNEALWNCARRHGYETNLLTRVESEGRSKEQAVDEQLHHRMARALLKHEPPQTLILVTGDGQEGEFGTSFVEYLSIALKKDWDVEVWSWKKQLSAKLKRLSVEQRREGQFSLFEFDRRYMRLVFVSNNGSACYTGTDRSVRNRHVNKLEPGDREMCKIL